MNVSKSDGSTCVLLDFFYIWHLSNDHEHQVKNLENTTKLCYEGQNYPIEKSSATLAVL